MVANLFATLGHRAVVSFLEGSPGCFELSGTFTGLE
jgi:hypothetical protein